MVTDVIVKGFHIVVGGIKKHTPIILAGISAGGTIATGVLAAIGTKKAMPVFQEYKKEMDEIKAEKLVLEKSEYNTKVRKCMTKTLKKVVIFYGPAAGAAAISISSELGAVKILKDRVAIISAGAVGLEQTFNEYRKRVRNKIGDEAEEDIYCGRETKGVTETITTEDGKKKKVTKFVKEQVEKPLSPVICLDQNNPNFIGDSPKGIWNRVRSIEIMANNRFDQGEKGLLLNDILVMLGEPRTEIGGIVGWVKTPDNPHPISFGMDEDRQCIQEFLESEVINGEISHPLWLHLNCNCENVLPYIY